MSNEGELYHYGRLGMKWGEHRYKDRYGGLNKAGKLKVRELANEHKKLEAINTLSKKGIKRLEDVEKQYAHLTGKRIGEHTPDKVGIKTPKRVEELTNEELSAYNSRKALENTYMSYQPKPQVSKGKQFASYVGNKVVLPIATELGKKWVNGYVIGKVNGVDNPVKYASKSLMTKGKDKDKAGD